jgi:hypothetical protein
MLRDKPIPGQNLFGLKSAVINPGEVKHYCADVGAPLIGDNVVIDRIITTFADNTDFVCGVVRVTMKQTFAPFKMAGPSTGTSGSIRLQRKVWRQPDCPECVARGRYAITVEGIALYDPTAPDCNKFSILWGVQ